MKNQLKNVILTACTLTSLSSVGAFSPISPSSPTFRNQNIYGRGRLPLALNVDAGVTDAIVNAWSSYNVALEEDPLLTK